MDYLPGGPFGPRIGNQSFSWSEDIKGARRMPWRGKSKKGAASCDKPGGGANGHRSPDSRMGEPTRGHARVPAAEYIGCEEATGGTETSKYPEEEKSTEIPGVAASETGPAQTRARASVQAFPHGGCWARWPGAASPGGGQKPPRQRNGLGRPAEQGESPVREAEAAADPRPRVAPGT